MSDATDDTAAVLLTVAIIARDEERNLPRALAGLGDFADEVVVVDTGSVDRTPVIAAESGARVVRHLWEDDFAAARNRALEAARGAWVLVLDADEEVDLLNGMRIRRACQQAPLATDGFLVSIVSGAGREDAAVDIHHLYPRLFRTGRGIRFRGAVHEEPVRDDGTPLARGLERLPVTLLHFGYADAAKNRLRIRRNLEILEREAERWPDRVDVGVRLAASRLIAGHVAAARGELEALLCGSRGRLDRPHEVLVRENLAMALERLGDPEGAARELERVLELAPGRLSARLTLAQLRRAGGDPRAALGWIDGLLRDAGGDGAAAEVRPRPAALHVLAGHCLLDLGDREGAGRALRAARALATGGEGVERLEARLALADARPTGACATISAAIIVRDGLPELAACLRSLAGAVDEIVVVDTGSRDASPAVARAAGARLVIFDWCDDFAAARNAALDAASGDWALVIDADEQLAVDAPDAIRALVARGDVDAARLSIANRTIAVDPLATRVERSIRLFRRLPAVRYRGRVHEQIEPALAAVGARVTDVAITIEHGGYASPRALAMRNRRNLRLLERAVAEAGHGVDGLLAFHHGLALAADGRQEEAIDALATAVEPARGLDPALAAHAHARMAQICLEHGAADAARPHLVEALAVCGDDLFTRYVAAAYHYHAGDPARAADALRRLLDDDAAAGCLRPGPVLLDLGDALDAAGDRPGAVRAFTEAARVLPGDPRPASRLRKIAQSNRFPESNISA